MATQDPKITMETLYAALVLRAEAQGQTPLEAPANDDAILLQAVRDVAALERIERALRNIAVRQCNGDYAHTDWGRAQEARDEERAERLGKKAGAILHPYGVNAILGGDVRGSQLRLHCPKTERHNTWGGMESGWAL